MNPETSPRFGFLDRLIKRFLKFLEPKKSSFRDRFIEEREKEEIKKTGKGFSKELKDRGHNPDT